MSFVPQMTRAATILSEWLGEGGRPVSVMRAESRAQVCSVCPKNYKGNWIDRLKKIAADTIREHIAEKNKMGCAVSTENEIGFCEQCGCCLSLKVWVPTKHIMAHTPQHEVLNYPEPCWVRHELTT